MLIHVLSGDSLALPFEKTGIEGEVVVCRECFVDGDARAASLKELWEVRSAFITENYGGSNQDYQHKTVEEFERLVSAAVGKEVVLWFEYELFCQVNLWFVVWLLRDAGAALSIAYPVIRERSQLWNGFRVLSIDELKAGFDSRIAMSEDDIGLAIDLWEAFRSRDHRMLGFLANRENACFPTLKTVVEAACEIETRPKEALRRIIQEGKREFGEVFEEFSSREPIYGFGDLQVKRIFDHLDAIDESLRIKNR